MLALLPSALAFRITGAELHEILGLAAVAAFALHNVLNRAWYRSLGADATMPTGRRGLR